MKRPQINATVGTWQVSIRKHESTGRCWHAHVCRYMPESTKTASTPHTKLQVCVREGQFRDKKNEHANAEQNVNINITVLGWDPREEACRSSRGSLNRYYFWSFFLMKHVLYL